MLDNSFIAELLLYALILDTFGFISLVIYLSFYKVKDMDRLLYGADHPIHHAFKAGGAWYGNLRAGGDYGIRFCLQIIAPERFDKTYPNNISLSEVPFLKKLPYVAYVVTGAIFAVGLLCFYAWDPMDVR